MQVIVALRTDAVTAAHAEGAPALLEALAEQLQRSTSELRKQLASSRFVSVEVADAAAAQDAINRLTQLPGVETAYVKPPDEPA